MVMLSVLLFWNILDVKNNYLNISQDYRVSIKLEKLICLIKDFMYMCY